MSNVLIRIKRAVLAGRFSFSRKAADEMDADDLTRLDVAESILNARTIAKTLRSRSPYRAGKHDTLYVIQSRSLVGIPVYTKGKLVVEAGVESYYFLVSAKRAM